MIVNLFLNFCNVWWVWSRRGLSHEKAVINTCWHCPNRLQARPKVILFVFLQTVFSLGSAFVHSVILFAFLRAVTAACLVGFFVSHYVYILELVGPSYRTLACKFTGFFWVGGHLVMALVSYFIRYWRHLLLVASFPPVLFALLTW